MEINIPITGNHKSLHSQMSIKQPVKLKKSRRCSELILILFVPHDWLYDARGRTARCAETSFLQTAAPKSDAVNIKTTVRWRGTREMKADAAQKTIFKHFEIWCICPSCESKITESLLWPATDTTSSSLLIFYFYNKSQRWMSDCPLCNFYVVHKLPCWLWSRTWYTKYFYLCYQCPCICTAEETTAALKINQILLRLS